MKNLKKQPRDVLISRPCKLFSDRIIHTCVYNGSTTAVKKELQTRVEKKQNIVTQSREWMNTIVSVWFSLILYNETNWFCSRILACCSGSLTVRFRIVLYVYNSSVQLRVLIQLMNNNRRILEWSWFTSSCRVFYTFEKIM